MVRCLNLARGPDIIRDLPAPAPAPGSARTPRRVGRSSSFLAPGSSAGAGGVARPGGARRPQGARLQRSVSSVSSCAGPGARAVVPRCGVRALVTGSSHTAAASSVHRSASIVSDTRSYPRNLHQRTRVSTPRYPPVAAPSYYSLHTRQGPRYLHYL